MSEPFSLDSLPAPHTDRMPDDPEERPASRRGMGGQEIDLPKGAAIAAIVRGDKVIMAHHDTVVLAEDHLIVFVTDKKLLPKVEKLFEVSAGFV